MSLISENETRIFLISKIYAFFKIKTNEKILNEINQFKSLKTEKELNVFMKYLSLRGGKLEKMENDYRLTRRMITIFLATLVFWIMYVVIFMLIHDVKFTNNLSIFNYWGIALLIIEYIIFSIKKGPLWMFTSSMFHFLSPFHYIYLYARATILESKYNIRLSRFTESSEFENEFENGSYKKLYEFLFQESFPNDLHHDLFDENKNIRIFNYEYLYREKKQDKGTQKLYTTGKEFSFKINNENLNFFADINTDHIEKKFKNKEILGIKSYYQQAIDIKLIESMKAEVYSNTPQDFMRFFTPQVIELLRDKKIMFIHVRNGWVTLLTHSESDLKEVIKKKGIYDSTDVTTKIINVPNNHAELKENVFNLFHSVYDTYLEHIDFIEKTQQSLN